MVKTNILDHFSIIFAIKLKGIDIEKDQKENFIYKRNVNEGCIKKFKRNCAKHLGIQ